MLIDIRINLDLKLDIRISRKKKLNLVFFHYVSSMRLLTYDITFDITY